MKEVLQPLARRAVTLGTGTSLLTGAVAGLVAHVLQLQLVTPPADWLRSDVVIVCAVVASLLGLSLVWLATTADATAYFLLSRHADGVQIRVARRAVRELVEREAGRVKGVVVAWGKVTIRSGRWHVRCRLQLDGRDMLRETSASVASRVSEALVKHTEMMVGAVHVDVVEPSYARQGGVR